MELQNETFKRTTLTQNKSDFEESRALEEPERRLTNSFAPNFSKQPKSRTFLYQKYPTKIFIRILRNAGNRSRVILGTKTQPDSRIINLLRNA